MKINFLKGILTLLLPAMFHIAGNTQSFTPEESNDIQISINSCFQVTQNHLSMEAGDKTVFNLKLSNHGNKAVDTYQSKNLIFQIPGTVDQFEITEWDNESAYIEIANCRCLNRGYNKIYEGTIKGKKDNSGQWHVSIDVIAKGKDNQNDITLNYEGEFDTPRN